jgi:uncharacterized protein
MKEAVALVEFIVTQITDTPDCFQLNSTIDENGVLLTLTVDKEQAGRVIGKAGATVQSIRALLRTIGAKNHARYNLKVEVME